MLCIILNRLVVNLIIDKIFLHNENVNQEVSSIQMYQHAGHPNRFAETRVLVERIFKFREVICSRFFNNFAYIYIY